MTNPVSPALVGFNNCLWAWPPSPDYMPAVAAFQPLYDRAVIGLPGDPVSPFDLLVASIVHPLKVAGREQFRNVGLY